MRFEYPENKVNRGIHSRLSDGKGSVAKNGVGNEFPVHRIVASSRLFFHCAQKDKGYPRGDTFFFMACNIGGWFVFSPADTYL